MKKSILLILLALPLSFSVAATEAAKPVQADVQVYFSPQGGARDALIREIGNAKNEILVQSFLFTDKKVAAALADAKKRGVTVSVISDKKMETAKSSQLPYLAKQGIEVYVDKKHSTAHNKILIIDDKKVITGSYNFVKKAEETNTENLLVLDSAELNQLYKDNWKKHLEHSESYQSK